MQINGTSQVHGTQKLSGPHFRQNTSTTQGTSAQPTDQVEISAEASEAARVAELAETRASEHVANADGVRTGLVDRLRSEIASGKYESADKIDAALDRFLDELG